MVMVAAWSLVVAGLGVMLMAASPSRSVQQVPWAGRAIMAVKRRAASLRVAAKPPGDLPDTNVLSTPQRDALTLGERQIPTRHSRGQARSLAASVTEPPGAKRLRHTDPGCRLLRTQPSGDPSPEPDRSSRHATVGRPGDGI